jgi:hypothetical protein
VALLPLQRNELYEVVKNGPIGMDRIEFSDQPLGARVAVRGSEYWWVVDQQIGSNDEPFFLMLFMPGKQTQSGRAEGLWHHVPGILFEWLENASAQLRAPDPWAQLAAQQSLLTGPAGQVDNSAFTAEEQASVVRALDEMVGYIEANANPTTDQLAAMRRDVDELKDAVGRLGRRDFFWELKGLMYGYIAEIFLPHAVVVEGVNFGFRAIGHIFGIHIPELPSPGS